MSKEPNRNEKRNDAQLRGSGGVPQLWQSLVRALEESPETGLTIESLVDVLLEGAATRPDLPGRRREIRVRLHHVDLPAFDDAGVLDYDPDRNEVRHVDSDRLERLRELVDETEETGR